MTDDVDRSAGDDQRGGDRSAWGLGIAALIAGVMAVAVVVLLVIGLRGLV